MAKNRAGTVTPRFVGSSAGKICDFECDRRRNDGATKTDTDHLNQADRSTGKEGPHPSGLAKSNAMKNSSSVYARCAERSRTSAMSLLILSFPMQRSARWRRRVHKVKAISHKSPESDNKNSRNLRSHSWQRLVSTFGPIWRWQRRRERSDVPCQGA